MKQYKTQYGPANLEYFVSNDITKLKLAGLWREGQSTVCQ